MTQAPGYSKWASGVEERPKCPPARFAAGKERHAATERRSVPGGQEREATAGSREHDEALDVPAGCEALLQGRKYGFRSRRGDGLQHNAASRGQLLPGLGQASLGACICRVEEQFGRVSAPKDRNPGVHAIGKGVRHAASSLRCTAWTVPPDKSTVRFGTYAWLRASTARTAASTERSTDVEVSMRKAFGVDAAYSS